MIQADVDGRMGPFTLRLGDCVNPILRPAGMLIPTRTGALIFKEGLQHGLQRAGERPTLAASLINDIAGDGGLPRAGGAGQADDGDAHATLHFDPQ